MTLDELLPWLGDLHALLPAYWADTVLVAVSVLCGTIIGIEREAKDKPAGLRTVTLICVGATIYTLASVLIAADHADRARIAAQVVTGVGFLGAGAIIRERGTVIGLTTGATIWTVAGIGVMIGAGYAAAGLVLSLVVLVMLRSMRLFEHLVLGPCTYHRCRLDFDEGAGRTRLLVRRVLDEHRIPQHARQWRAEGELVVLDLSYCRTHAGHRAVLGALAELPALRRVADEADAAGA